MKTWLVMFRGGFQRMDMFPSELSKEEIIEGFKRVYRGVDNLQIQVVELSDDWELIGKVPVNLRVLN